MKPKESPNKCPLCGGSKKAGRTTFTVDLGDQVETMDVINNPEDLGAGTRKLPFSRGLYIEHEEFQEVPPPKYYRRFPGNECACAPLT